MDINRALSTNKGIYFKTDKSGLYIRKTKTGIEEIFVDKSLTLVEKIKFKLKIAKDLGFGFILVIFSLAKLLDLIPILINNGFSLFKVPLRYYVVLLGFIILSFFVKKYSSFARYHAAEHMSITCLEYINSSDEFNLLDDLTIENIKLHDRVDPICGTRFAVLIGIFLLIMGILETFFPIIQPFSILYYLAFAFFITSSAFSLDSLPKILKDSIYNISFFIQKHITTAEPSDDDLKLAIRGINSLYSKQLEK